MTETTIKNSSNHVMRISWVSLFWNGKAFIELPKREVLFEPGESRLLEEPNGKGLTYVTTLLTCVNEELLDIADTFGQKDTSFLCIIQQLLEAKL